MKICEPVLKNEYFSVEVDKSHYQENGIEFKKFPEALYATDVFFCQGSRPQGSFADQLVFFSGKHHLYGLKTEVSVNAHGQAVNALIGICGSKHDKSIFMENISFHKKSTKKTKAEAIPSDNGDGGRQQPKKWGILLDKAYIGVQDTVRGIIPKKKPRAPGRLDNDAWQRNLDIASDRVIVENYFGRLTTMFGLFAKKYTWSRERFPVVMSIALSLTNFSVLKHPLRSQEVEYYKMILADLDAKGEKAKNANKERQRLYRERQRQ